MCAIRSSLFLNNVLRHTGQAGVESLLMVAVSDCEVVPFAGLLKIKYLSYNFVLLIYDYFVFSYLNIASK